MVYFVLANLFTAIEFNLGIRTFLTRIDNYQI